MIDPDLARALALSPTDSRTKLTAAMIREGTGDPYLGLGDFNFEYDLPAAVIEFMNSLAETLAQWLWDDRPISLTDRVPAFTRGALRQLNIRDAPAVLAYVAPHQVIPAGPAKDMGRACRALLAKHLPEFIGRILHHWIDLGLLRPV